MQVGVGVVIERSIRQPIPQWAEIPTDPGGIELRNLSALAAPEITDRTICLEHLMKLGMVLNRLDPSGSWAVLGLATAGRPVPRPQRLSQSGNGVEASAGDPSATRLEFSSNFTSLLGGPDLNSD